MRDATKQRRLAACHAFIKDPTDRAWQKLQEAIAADSMLDQGLERLYAARALDVAEEDNAGDSNVSFDDLASTSFSISDDGIFVSGWYWVSNRAVGLLPEAEDPLDPETQKMIDGLQRPQLLLLLGEEDGGCCCSFLEDHTDESLRKAVAGFLDSGDLDVDQIAELCDEDS